MRSCEVMCLPYISQSVVGGGGEGAIRSSSCGDAGWGFRCRQSVGTTVLAWQPHTASAAVLATKRGTVDQVMLVRDDVNTHRRGIWEAESEEEELRVILDNCAYQRSSSSLEEEEGANCQRCTVSELLDPHT